MPSWGRGGTTGRAAGKSAHSRQLDPREDMNPEAGLWNQRPDRSLPVAPVRPRAGALMVCRVRQERPSALSPGLSPEHTAAKRRA